MARQPALVVAGAALAVGGLLAGTSLAGQQTFSDVPPDHPFYLEIEGMAAAGITTGYPDGTYRPGDPVSRQAMAAFLVRGFGRVVADEGATELGGTSDADAADLVTLELPAGAADSGGGYVLLTGSATFSAEHFDGADGVSMTLNDLTGFQLSSEVTTVLPSGDEADADGVSRTSLAHTWVYPIAADGTGVYALTVEMTDPGIEVHPVDVSGSLSALYVPFGTSTYGP